MTDNRETIAMLKMLKEQALKSHNDTAVLEVKIDSFNFVLDEAIKALEQQPCEDCISRQAVLDGLASIAKVKARSDAQKSLMGRIMFFVEQLPPVTPKEKTGRWIHREDMDYLDENEVMHNHFMCKDCGFIHDFIDGHTVQYRYCPSCGAKMVEPQESEVRNEDSD